MYLLALGHLQDTAKTQMQIFLAGLYLYSWYTTQLKYLYLSLRCILQMTYSDQHFRMYFNFQA